MTSLAGLIPDLAQNLCVSPNAIYERQRALMRADLLAFKPGRGPGSGVEATPESVALLLISILAPGGLARAHTEVRAIAKLKSTGNQSACPLTGKRTFGAALAAILANEDLAQRVELLSVEQWSSATMTPLNVLMPDRFGASFIYKPVGKPKGVRSDFRESEAAPRPPLGVTSQLFFPLHKIAHALKEADK
jgi:hypothetical protein